MIDILNKLQHKMNLDCIKCSKFKNNNGIKIKC